MATATATSSAAVARRRRDLLAHTLASRRLPEGVAEAGERVPGAVAPEVMPFLRAADAVEPLNPCVAFLCRKYAFKKVQIMDPSSIQRGVRQFKTYMSLKLDQDDTQVLGNDAREIQRFYKEYCASMSGISEKRNFEDMAKYYQVASALYEMLRDVTNNKVDPQVIRCAEMVEQKGRHFKNYKYNIIPLNFPGSSEAIVELPEIRCAIDAISSIDGLPKPHMSSMNREGDESIQDLLDWLSLAFGFQKSNVENQRENMVLLLANISTRTAGQEGHPLVDTVNELWKKIFANYKSWCRYLHVSSHIMIRHDDTEQKKQQLKLLHIGLYLLIWGEASNVRFMPECLCYIFHHMAKQLQEMVDENYFQPPPSFEEEGSFLKNVIEPIFKVLQKEAQKSRGGTAGHSTWRNYDDLNELFWSEKCFTKLKWPWDLTSDFFYQGKDPNYKRMVMACFIQAVYLLELDRQDQKGEEDGLAPKWWKPFKYKVTQTLVDERDGSIYGAVLEWDRSSALSDFILLRPSGAPRAVLALRGTLLQKQTMKRDLQDDLHFLVWESLKGSVRFIGALEALKAAVEKFGSTNVCVAGHSLGAGFALQVCKELAKQGVFVECHLFNPPSVSLAMSVRSISEKASYLWKKVKASLPLKEETTTTLEIEKEEASVKKRLRTEKKWVPHLYVNNSDYICCHYNAPSYSSTEADGASNDQQQQRKASEIAGDVIAKLFVASKGPQKFMEAHGLEQWWSDGMELQLALYDSKLINRQLKSIYTTPAVSSPAKS